MPGRRGPRRRGRRPSGRPSGAGTRHRSSGSRLDGTGDRVALWCGRHAVRSTLMNHAARRVLVALVVLSVAVGGWLMSPRFDPSSAPTAIRSTPAPSATPVASLAASPVPTSGANPSALSIASPSPSVAPVGHPVPPGTLLPGTLPPRRIGSPSATPLLRNALDARLGRLREKYGIPGMSAAIVFADGSIWRGTAGDADVATGVQVTPDTSFSVASVSKTFTAALTLALIEDGRLSPAGPAKSYLPSLPIHPAITVRELLDHTSGLRDFYFGGGNQPPRPGKPNPGPGPAPPRQ